MKMLKFLFLIMSVVLITSLIACGSTKSGKSDIELVKEALKENKWRSSQKVGNYNTIVELTFEDSVYQTRVVINTQTISAVIHEYEIKDGKIICYTDDERTVEFSYTIENGKAVLDMGSYSPSSK